MTTSAGSELGSWHSATLPLWLGAPSRVGAPASSLASGTWVARAAGRWLRASVVLPSRGWWVLRVSFSRLLCFARVQALVIAGISLQAANLYGYILCKMGGESDISKVTTNFLSQTVFQTVSCWHLIWTTTPQPCRVEEAAGTVIYIKLLSASLPQFFYCGKVYTKLTLYPFPVCSSWH